MSVLSPVVFAESVKTVFLKCVDSMERSDCGNSTASSVSRSVRSMELRSVMSQSSSASIFAI